MLRGTTARTSPRRPRVTPKKKTWPHPVAVNYGTADDGGGTLSTLLFMTTDGGPERAATQTGTPTLSLNAATSS